VSALGGAAAWAPSTQCALKAIPQKHTTIAAHTSNDAARER